MENTSRLHAWRHRPVNTMLTPVDFVARAVMHFVKNPDALEPVLHVNNPRRLRWSELIELLRCLGCSIRAEPLAAWTARIVQRGRAGQPTPMDAFVPLLRQRRGDRLALEDCYVPVEASADRLVRRLAPADIHCPAPDADLLARYLRFLGVAPGAS